MSALPPAAESSSSYPYAPYSSSSPSAAGHKAYASTEQHHKSMSSSAAYYSSSSGGGGGGRSSGRHRSPPSPPAGPYPPGKDSEYRRRPTGRSPSPLPPPGPPPPSSGRYVDARDRDDRYSERYNDRSDRAGGGGGGGGNGAADRGYPERYGGREDRYNDRDDRYNDRDERYAGGGGGGYGGGGRQGRSPPPSGAHYGRGSGREQGGGGRDGDDRRPRAPKRPVVRGSDEDRRTTTHLFLGNIPYHFGTRDITDLAERYGPVQDITLPMDRMTGKNKGFCFIDFKDRRDAEDFFDDMARNGTLEGRRVKIDWDVGKDKKGIDGPRRDGRRDDDRDFRDDRGDGGNAAPSGRESRGGGGYERREYSPRR